MNYRIIGFQRFPAALNMGLDEALMETVRETGQGVIRIYGWAPSAISIGYFQGLKNEVDIDACKAAGVEIVRRLTGGGAVYHDTNGEVTYSIIGPEKDFFKDILASYQEICGTVIKALESIGIKSVFQPINDILADGKKISGNAQTRRGGVLLQHGTLLYDVDVDKMFSLLKVDKEKIADKLIQSVKKRVTSIKQLKDIPFSDVVKAVDEAFQARGTERSCYHVPEMAKAKELSKKYASDEWINMR
ncbi:MAG: biotin/lipoate A/B protein ligase family protein [Nanoarchaeota archaeon]